MPFKNACMHACFSAGHDTVHAPAGVVQRFSVGFRGPLCLISGFTGVSPPLFATGAAIGALGTMPLQLTVVRGGSLLLGRHLCSCSCTSQGLRTMHSGKSPACAGLLLAGHAQRIPCHTGARGSAKRHWQLPGASAAGGVWCIEAEGRRRTGQSRVAPGRASRGARQHSLLSWLVDLPLQGCGCSDLWSRPLGHVTVFVSHRGPKLTLECMENISSLA